MVKTQEFWEVFEKFEKFLTSYSVKILRSLSEVFTEAEKEIIEFLKGKRFSLPIGMLQKNLEKALNSGEFAEKISRAIFDRFQALNELVKTLGEKIGKDSAHQPLLEMMEKGEPYEIAFSSLTISCLGHSQAREKLKTDLSKFSRSLRWSLLTILEKDSEPGWLPIYLSFIDDPEPEIARLAVSGVGKTGNSSMASSLIPLLSKKSEVLVISAVQALGFLRNPSAILPLMELGAATKSEKIRATVASALGEFPETGTIHMLNEFLKHFNPRVRANAAMALKKKFLALNRRDESVIQNIVKLLEDPDHRVRADATQCLWELGRIESVDHIKTMMLDPEAASRASAAYLCGKLKLFQLKEDLVSLTQDSVLNVRKTAAIALLSLGESGKSALEELILSGTQDQQVCAAFAISLAGDGTGVDQIFSLANSETELSEIATEFLLKPVI